MRQEGDGCVPEVIRFRSGPTEKGTAALDRLAVKLISFGCNSFARTPPRPSCLII